MKHSQKREFLRLTVFASSILSLLSVDLLVVLSASLVLRPITNGVINQTYLYTESSGTVTHKGVDFPVVTGTAVYATEAGVVVDLAEGFDNDTHGGIGFGFGNYVVVRHNGLHWIRQNNGSSVNAMGYVFSIYGHLSKNSVIPIISSAVTTGQLIAQTDNTGNSSGPHLHYQVILYTDYGWTLLAGNSETRSRNPELWLSPRTVNSTQQATVVGKVTNASGDPVGGLRICGLQKYNDPALDYDNFGYVQTYASTYSWANPDDILIENFGTTDVTPGTYHLYARYADGTQVCNGTLYKDLGNYTFTAGQITYVGLYPIYLPDVRANYYGWNSTITIRNNSTTDTAQVTTTFFWSFNTAECVKGFETTPLRI